MASNCITSFVGIIITVISFLLSFWLVSRNRPSIYLETFYYHTASTTNTTKIYFDLKIQNENYLVGVYYKTPVTLTFTYLPPTISTNTNLTIAKYTIQGFYQGNGKAKQVQDSVEVKNFLLVTDSHRKLEETYVPLTGPAKVAAFRVDFDAYVKFKSIENKKSHLMAGTIFDVNYDTGIMVQNEGVKLEYSSGSNWWGFLQWLMFFVLFALFKTCFWVGLYLFVALYVLIISCVVASQASAEVPISEDSAEVLISEDSAENHANV